MAEHPSHEDASSSAPAISPHEVEQRLAALRVSIDEIDRTIVEVLNRRARLAIEVGEVKKLTEAPVYRPEREAQIMARLRERNPGPLPGAAIEGIYREIISACREIERRMRVAFLGPPGTFSELALHKHFGSAVDTVPCASIDEVFRATQAGSADFGIVPVENSSEGAVNRSLDLFLQSPLLISGEVSLPVQHNLLSVSGELADVKRVCAHAQALAQCQGWLDHHAHGIERVPVSSNAEGARLASVEPGTAAIAADIAASRYGLQFIAHHIQDDPNNRTRFVVIGNYACAPSGEDQTSMILSVPDRAGAVHSLIEPLARHGVSMKRFESRPARQGFWEYYFYIDVIGHSEDPPIKAALAELRANAAFCKLIGSYPRARQ
ncbi:MAG: prephenate dehydratase [Burkholderiaceae bacterium]